MTSVNNYHMQLTMLDSILEDCKKLEEEIELTSNHFPSFDKPTFIQAKGLVEKARKKIELIYKRKTDYGKM